MSDLRLVLREDDLNRLLKFWELPLRYHQGLLQGELVVMTTALSFQGQLFSDSQQLALAMSFEEMGGSLLGSAARWTWPVWSSKLQQQCRRWESQAGLAPDSIELHPNKEGIILSIPYHRLLLPASFLGGLPGVLQMVQLQIGPEYLAIAFQLVEVVGPTVRG